MNNCLNCNFASLVKSGCVCNIHLLMTDQLVKIKKSKIKKECPCHSCTIHEENRYGYQSSDKRNSPDICSFCNRQARSEFLSIIKSKDQKNKTIKKRICAICNGKIQTS
jgi:hypothetical protein